MYKSFVKNNNISTAIILFLVIFIIFVHLKPHFLFNRTGCFRNFGLGKTNCTILPIWLFVILLSIISYLAVMYFLL